MFLSRGSEACPFASVSCVVQAVVGEEGCEGWKAGPPVALFTVGGGGEECRSNTVPWVCWPFPLFWARYKWKCFFVGTPG